LQPRHLARELDLSLTPVREALIELAAEGLIEMQPHRGPHVASTDVESLEELYLLRETLEGLAVQLAAERMTDAELVTISNIHEQFVEQHALHAAERLAELSDEFHMAIYSAAKTPMLLRLVKIVLAAAPSGILASIPGRADRSLTDHAKLLAPLKTRDAALASKVMRKHLHDTLGFVDDFQRKTVKTPTKKAVASRPAAAKKAPAKKAVATRVAPTKSVTARKDPVAKAPAKKTAGTSPRKRTGAPTTGRP